MHLNELNTKYFIYDPNANNFMKKICALEEFTFKVEGIDKKKICTYIALMCDQESDIRKNYSHYGKRKFMGGQCAGFTVHESGRFSRPVEDIMVGKNKDVNKAVVKYLSLSYDPYFVRHSVFQTLLYAATEDILSGDTKLIPVAEKLVDKLRKEEEFIFGGNEVRDMRKALYEESAKRDLHMRPEDIAEGLTNDDDFNDFSKYGIDYKVEDLHFIGDGPPEEGE